MVSSSTCSCRHSSLDVFFVWSTFVILSVPASKTTGLCLLHRWAPRRDNIAKETCQQWWSIRTTLFLRIVVWSCKYNCWFVHRLALHPPHSIGLLFLSRCLPLLDLSLRNKSIHVNIVSLSFPTSPHCGRVSHCSAQENVPWTAAISR